MLTCVCPHRFYLPPGSYDPILPPQCYGNVCSTKNSRGHDCFKLAYEDVREVLKRRYLLQPIALEIFCSDGRNYLLAFPRKIRNVVFAKFTSASKLSDSGIADASKSVAGQKRTTSVEGAGLFSSLIGETSVTQRWVVSIRFYLREFCELSGANVELSRVSPVTKLFEEKSSFTKCFRKTRN